MKPAWIPRLKELGDNAVRDGKSTRGWCKLFKEPGVAPDGQLWKAHNRIYTPLEVLLNTNIKLLIGIARDVMKWTDAMHHHKIIEDNMGAFVEVILKEPGAPGGSYQDIQHRFPGILCSVLIQVAAGNLR